MRNLMLIIISFYILVFLSGCQTPRYVLPAADGETDSPSPPHVVGKIESVADSLLTIRINPSETIRVRFDSQTALFTSDGGYVPPQELAPKLNVRIWYITLDPREAGTPPLAAVVEISFP